MAQKSFHIVINKFYQGFSPTYWKNSLSEFGNPGHANAMADCDIFDPTYITQGPGLTDLTNGNEGSVVDESVFFILDETIDGAVSYALGSTKLFQLTFGGVTDDNDFPHTVTNMSEGKSIVTIGDTVFYLYNTSGAGDIGKLTGSSTFDDDWGSTSPTGAAALNNANHPSASKEDMFMFGNGRFAGIYTKGDDTLDTEKLDFGSGTSVQDIIFNKSHWLIAVNKENTGNISSAQVYLYDASGVSNLLSDEMSLTIRKIGWIKAVNGIVYITYDDTVGGAFLGYISGRSIVPLKRIPSLPEPNQKTLHDGYLLFVANSEIYAAGSSAKELPYTLSQHGDAGYPNVKALANPFGTPYVASDNSPGFRIAQFSGFSTNATWTSLIFTLLEGDRLGVIDKIVVLTPSLGAGARCDMKIKTNQEDETSSALQITGTGKRRHVFKKTFNDLEDFRVLLEWFNGSSSNDCPIREIHIMGHYKEK